MNSPFSRRLSRRYQTLLLITLFLVWSLITQGAQARAPRDIQDAPLKTVSPGELILAMNTLRVSYGLPALIEDPIIDAVAQSTAETMAANNMSWHIGDVRGRLAAAGYGGGATVWATENFAVGNMTVDEIMQVWSDADHMRPAVNPAYCHVGAGVAQASNGRYYYILQAAYTSENACGEYTTVTGEEAEAGGSTGSQLITPVQIATPDAEGRVYHIVQAGQSFWSIAIAYQVTIHDLEDWNNLSSDYPLFVGQKLFIPSSDTAGYATPTPLGLVIVATPDAEGVIVHVVQPYQALIRIAEAYQVPLETILALNNWQAEWPLQIGQKLLISAEGDSSPPLSALERLTPASDGNYYHEVRSGESLTWIADRYDVNVADLMAWNGLSQASIIRPGQKLLLRVTPPPTRTPHPTQRGSTATLTPTPTLPEATPDLITIPPSKTPVPGTQATRNRLDSILSVLAIVAALLALGWLVRQR